MTPHFYDVVIGGVLLAPILRYGLPALVIYIALRPLLRRIGFARFFANPSLAEFGLLVSIFGLLTLLNQELR